MTTRSTTVRSTTTLSTWSPALWSPAILTAAALALGACAAKPQTAADEPPSAGLDALANQPEPRTNADLSDTSDAATRQKLDLMAAALAAEPPQVTPVRRTPPPAPARAEEAPAKEPLADAPSAGLDAIVPEAAPAVGETNVASNQPAALEPEVDPKVALVNELATVLRARAKDADDPTAALLQLAALELLGPDGASLAAAPDERTLSRLSPREQEFVKAWRATLASAGKELSGSSDVAALAKKVSDLAAKLSAYEPLSIPTAVLAERVEAFGSYTELPRSSGGAYQFIAGRPAKAVVYVEIAGHTHNEKSERGVTGFEVALTQTLKLYHASKDQDLLAWQAPPGEIRDFARAKRRDFFVRQIVSLPANLTIGAYRLKVELRDNTTSAVAEAVIPIEIVGDATAMAGDK